jgi:hypothetical protein
MGYIGNQTSNSYTSLDKQTITGNGGASYTLDHAVANENEIEVFVNNVRQEPSVAYTVSGTALTMTGNVESSDDFYVVFQGKAIQTTAHPEGQDLKARDGTFSGDLAVDTDTLYVDSTNDHVGIGTTSIASLGSQHKTLQINGRNTSNAGALRLRSTDNSVDSGLWASSSATYLATISNDPLHLRTNNTDRMIIDSSGVVTTSRESSDGTMLSLKRGTTERAKITVGSTDNIIISATSGGGSGFQLWGSGGTDPIIGPVKEGVSNNGDVQLGRSSERYKNLYLAGEGGSTAAIDVRQGSAKVWAYLEQSGTHSVYDSYNVASVTDIGTGQTQVNIANDMNNDNYVQTGSGGDSNNRRYSFYDADMNAGDYDIEVYQVGSNTSRADASALSTIVMGDLA